MGSAPRRCLVCGKPCDSWERNTDGTHAHAKCLYVNATWPIDRSKTGKNLYNLGEDT